MELVQIKESLDRNYGIEADSMESFDYGMGSQTALVTSENNKYVVKYPVNNEMNHLETEVEICKELLEKGIPVCDFLTNTQGKSISVDEAGRSFTVQSYYEGTIYDYNEAPKVCQKESACMLGRIQNAMKAMKDLPVGIGEDFFKFRKPKDMIKCYENTLQQAMQQGEKQIYERIQANIKLAKTFPDYIFDMKRFSVGNTHGDYNTSQIIWRGSGIAGVIDWISACRHPYIWEIVRSYLFMAPECKNGDIDIDSFIDYLKAYMEYNPLNTYDITNAGRLIHYFFMVCDFYGQYLNSGSQNRTIFLKQADMSWGLLQWFQQNIDELNNRLKLLSLDLEYRKKMVSYYDPEGRLIQYPSKKPMRDLALNELAASFEQGKKYTEKEVNQIISSHIAFGDIELIRRELFQAKLLGRFKDGSQYWLEEN